MGENGETQTEYYIKIIKSLFGTKPNLDRIILVSDREYWNKQLIKHILKHGGDILGTVKRSYWYHFAHDKNLRKTDPRILLGEKGPSTLFTTETTIEGMKMTAFAYGAGTKNISLTMSANFEGVSHDCVIDNQNKNKNNNNDHDSIDKKKALTFRLFGRGKYFDATNDSIVYNILQNMPMRHVAERQGSSE